MNASYPASWANDGASPSPPAGCDAYREYPGACSAATRLAPAQPSPSSYAIDTPVHRAHGECRWRSASGNSTMALFTLAYRSNRRSSRLDVRASTGDTHTRTHTIGLQTAWSVDRAPLRGAQQPSTTRTIECHMPAQAKQGGGRAGNVRLGVSNSDRAVQGRHKLTSWPTSTHVLGVEQARRELA